MDKTYQTEIRRTFLVQGLPEPLTPASSHLQIFDNYPADTRLRLRAVRVPVEKKWTWTLEQRFPLTEKDLSTWKTAQIFLNEREHQKFEIFTGREIRKNRYFYDLEDNRVEIDVYLGRLWGLNLMNVYFETDRERKAFEIPPVALFEVTQYKFFTGGVLVDKNFEDVRAEFEKIRDDRFLRPEC